MKWLSVRQPWASLIACGLKDIENRTRSTSYRGPVMIHASVGFDDAAQKALLDGEMLGLDGKAWLPFMRLAHAAQPGGYALATVDIVDCVRDSESPWAQPGNYHLVLANPRPLSELVPFKGQRGTPLYNGPDVDMLYRPHDGTTRRVDLRQEVADVVITRPSKWGNPCWIDGKLNIKTGADPWTLYHRKNGVDHAINFFPNKRLALRACLECYETRVLSSPKLMKAIKNGELHGKRLGCFCGPDDGCHGDVLVKIDREVHGK